MIVARLQAEHYNVQPDMRDAALLAERLTAWIARNDGPRVGDTIRWLDREYGRFTHDWGDGIQTTWKGHGEGSFFIDRNGHASYSGPLDPMIDKTRLIDTGEHRLSRFWFFHHDHMTAHNGVGCYLPCRVYTLRED